MKLHKAKSNNIHVLSFYFFDGDFFAGDLVGERRAIFWASGWKDILFFMADAGEVLWE